MSGIYDGLTPAKPTLAQRIEVILIAIAGAALGLAVGAVLTLVGWNLLGFGEAVGASDLSFWQAAGFVVLAAVVGVTNGASKASVE